LPAASAVELLAALDGVECPADDMTAFVASEHGPDGTEEEAAAVHAALATLKAWLAEVSPGSVGLLSVGKRARNSFSSVSACDRLTPDGQLALEPETFVPQEATRLFVLALNNYAAVILAPSLVTAVITTAPGIRLDLRPSGLRDMPALLDRGELDVAIGTFEDAGQRFAAAPLLEDSFVVAMRRDHPAAQRELTEEALAGLSYLEISLSGEAGFCKTHSRRKAQAD
jgi:hypothetical protein